MPAPKGNRYAAGNKGGGHPTDYVPKYAKIAFQMALLGATDAEMAAAFDVHEETVRRWKKAHKEFALALTRGKTEADANVAEKLYRRAMGYSHEAVKIFQYEGEPVIVPYTEHYPPDTQAASLWLRNRQPKLWRDKHDVEHSGTLTLEQLVAQSLTPEKDEK